MRPELRERALLILSHYWRRDFTFPRDLPAYIAGVRLRLARFGVRSVPSDPVQFLAFCQELDLFKTPRSMRRNPKKAS